MERSVVHINVLCGGGTTALVVALMNPLDVLRIRFQTRLTKVGALQFAAEQWHQHGVRLWLPGLGVNAMSVAVSSGLRIGTYPAIRDRLVDVLRVPSKDPATLLMAGLLSGTLGFALATPLFAAKIRAQVNGPAASESAWTSVRKTWARKPFSGASILVVRGALLSAGANAGCACSSACTGEADATRADDLAKTNLKPHISEGPLVHALSSVVAAWLACTLSMPADAVMTRFQSSAPGTHTGPWACALSMWRTDKAALYRGWGFFFLRVAPTWMMQMPLYEAARRFMGIGFQT